MRQVILCQHGARHRYAIARILEEKHRLKALYTDSSAHSTLGRLAALLASHYPTQRLSRLANRTIQGVPFSKIHSTDTVFYHRLAYSLLGKEPDPQIAWGKWLSSKMIHWGVQSGDIIYNMYCENLDFLQYARKVPGVTIITDMYINPLQRDIVKKFHIDGAPLHYGIDVFPKDVLRRVCELSDLILCPSNFVKEGVLKLSPETANRIQLCAYGSSLTFPALTTIEVKRGRFFWAGGDWFRKGLHLLAAVADKLKQEFPDMEFRAAGIAQESIEHPERFRNITFLGRLNRQQMIQEFQQAEAFVFPSLCEGMAGVVLEAISCGCPVITTHEAGIDGIVNGENSIIVPTGDTVALKEAIQSFYKNRKERSSLMKNAESLLNGYSEEAWGIRLESILEKLENH